jgi:hypothetical protein
VLLLRIFVFILLAFFSHSAWTQRITAAGSQPALVSPVVVSSGWQITTFVLNNLGTVAFAGGQNPFSADGLVLVRSKQFLQFAAWVISSLRQVVHAESRQGSHLAEMKRGEAR